MSRRRSGAFAVALAVLIGCPRPQQFLAQEKQTDAAKPVARVAGAPITEEELSKAAAPELDKLEIEKLQSEANFARSRHQIRENALSRLVEERLLAIEAAKLGITAKELLAREVDQKVKEPTGEEVNVFYEANKARMPRSKEQIAPQILQYLKNQNYNTVKREFLDRLTKAYGVTLGIDPLRFEVEAAGHPSRGPARSPVIIIEFSDFQCSYCRGFNATLDRITREYGNQVRLVFRQFPLTEVHPYAAKAAEASLCANEQGRFWEMHDLMFGDQANLKVEDLKSKAAKLGLDAPAFGTCLDSGRQAKRIQQDVRDGARAGVSGTPALFINGRFIGGARPYDDVVAIINDELQRHSTSAKR